MNETRKVTMRPAVITECSLPVSRRKLKSLPFTRTGTSTALLTTLIFTVCRAEQSGVISSNKMNALGIIVAS